MDIIPERKSWRICINCNDNVPIKRWIICKGCKGVMCSLHIHKFNTMIYDFNNNQRVRGYFCIDCFAERLY